MKAFTRRTPRLGFHIAFMRMPENRGEDRTGKDGSMSSRLASVMPMRVGVAVAAIALEVAAMALFGLTETHHDILGIIGAVAVLIAVAASALAGPLVGCLAALAGGIAFFGFVTEWGGTAPLTATILSVVIWSLSALMTGIVADRLRQQRAARRAAEEEAAHLHARLESSLLPHLDAQHGELRLTWRYLPNESRLGISGDFYDAAGTQDGRLAVVIGDVVGHGADAAALGATLRASWHALVLSGASESQLITALSGVLAREERSPEAFVTLCLAWFDGDGSRASFLLLGHPAPLLLSKGVVERVAVRPELPLGLADGGDCVATSLALPSAWSLLLYTDGLVEGHAGDGSRKRFGLERLLALLRREAGPEARDELAEGALDRVLDSVITANGGALPDDAAVFCVSKAA
jgi:serine phosphatase RsbU (regulator of sigma subunit)